MLSQANDTNAIVRRDFGNPEEQFGFHAYPKGAWILHMLRSQLGEDLFRRCIKTYLERYAFGNVTTEDLNRVLEEVSGRSFDQFFNQYVYHAHHPELNISYSWDERTKLAKLSIQQVQRLSDDVLLFNVPLPVRFKTKSGVVERTLPVKEKTEDFYVPLNEAPDMIRIDPNVTVLAKITFNPPTSMLHAQLADKDDMPGRLLAVEQLSGKKDALGKLKDVLNGDSFYAVRLAASQGIRAMQSDEALDALIASLKQSDARVRQRVVSDIAGFYREKSYAALTQVLQDEKNPDIRATAIAGLGVYAKPEVREELLRALKSNSYRNHLADAAINALRAQADPEHIPALLEVLRDREKAFTSGGFANGLSTVAWLARDEEKKDDVRELLLKHLNSPRQRVQLAAIAGLGALGDARAIAPLETFSSAPKESRERTAAEQAIAKLRDARKTSAEVGGLRNEVLTLQRDNRELRKEFEDLKKKFETAIPKSTDSKSKAAIRPRK